MSVPCHKVAQAKAAPRTRQKASRVAIYTGYCCGYWNGCLLSFLSHGGSPVVTIGFNTAGRSPAGRSAWPDHHGVWPAIDSSRIWRSAPEYWMTGQNSIAYLEHLWNPWILQIFRIWWWLHSRDSQERGNKMKKITRWTIHNGKEGQRSNTQSFSRYKDHGLANSSLYPSLDTTCWLHTIFAAGLFKSVLVMWLHWDHLEIQPATSTDRISWNKIPLTEIKFN